MASARFVALAALALSATACSKAPEAPPVPNVKDGIEVANARLVLPVLKGNPGAVYFTITNNTAQAVTIATVDVQGAEMAMMHETINSGTKSSMQHLPRVVVGSYKSVTFAPGGKHVMAMGLSEKVRARSMSKLTITFDDGDKTFVDLPVIPPATAGE